MMNLKIVLLKRCSSIRKKNLMYFNSSLEEKDARELNTVEEALKKQEWSKVMEEKVIALWKNETNDLMQKSKDVKPIY